jgi:hypothetical protein
LRKLQSGNVACAIKQFCSNLCKTTAVEHLTLGALAFFYFQTSG